MDMDKQVDDCDDKAANLSPPLNPPYGTGSPANFETLFVESMRQRETITK